MRKKIYIILPLVMLAAFAFYFRGYSKEAERMAKEKEEAARVLKIQEEKDRAEYQKKIADDARKVAEEKRKEAERKAAIIEAEKNEYEALQLVQSDLSKKHDDAMELSYSLSSQIREEEDLAKRAKARIDILADEKKFLDQYIPISTSNRDRYMTFLKKVEDTKKAVEAANAAAAAAAKRR
jgi:hypothetical protein